MRLILISDTHGYHHNIKVPEGDILIHAGDFSMKDTFMDLLHIDSWFGTLPHQNKIIIAGNHDFYLEEVGEQGQDHFKNAIYLMDQKVNIEGVNIYGSPWQPEFMNWAFNLPRGKPIKEKWDQIPEDTNILITHGPPHGILDEADFNGAVGCEDLLEAVQRVKPDIHVFGHIHEGYGVEKREGTTFVNASICSLAYRPINQPIIIDL